VEEEEKVVVGTGGGGNGEREDVPVFSPSCGGLFNSIL
jgi:hypothetical protein